ncbi:helix-turn-helix transcriptional regulator [Arthrobacter sp. CG_A4]|uniref:helix-turn-helix transcriptional regulator n=1 Tax=Arthrobacter sp. CG_A4 TaxID=3071706 RepID=UPI002E02427D|nr:putative DNA-binding transcriptional regulator YafY [Arthrobacter sp. CG_A4]
MLETSARLLQLLSLLQTHRDWSAVELSARLEITERTVRRDMARLRLLGYPVEARPGTGGGYRLGIGAALPPLLLDDDEAVAVAVGLRGATVSGLAGIDETAVRALAKLEQFLPSRLRHRVQTLNAAIVPMTGSGTVVDVDVLVAVAAAIRDHQQLRADYRNHDGAPARRVLEPHRIVHSGRRWYLVAWDLGRLDWRTFRLDRFMPRTPTGPRFVPRAAPGPDIAAYVSRGVSTGAYRYQCRVTIEASAGLVAERIGPGIGVITGHDDGRCELVTGSNSLDELALHLGLIGEDFTVHSPAALRERMATLGARLTRASEQPGDTP